VKHAGDLTITAANAAQFAGLEEVTGGLDISAENAQLPALTSVGGGLDISAGSRLTAPLLKGLSGHDFPDDATAAQRIRDVAAAALVSDSALDMSRWHTCGSTHCIAGWAIHQAGPDGYKLEKQVESAAAGAILLGLEAAHHFHLDNAAARDWLKSKLAQPLPAEESGGGDK
jgi:hypothetical protein